MMRTFNGQCQKRWSSLFALAVMIGVSPGVTSAHDLYTAFIQHRVQLEVGAQHIDLTLDLTFFEEWSSRERRLMDADKDGRITRAEIEWYLMKLAPALAKQVRLLVGGREVALAELYEPEVDLLGSDQAGPAHHRLRLFLFAPTPSTLGGTNGLVIDDRLWPDAKALVTLQAEGRDGCRLEPEKLADPTLPPAQTGEARVFKVRCLTPPKAQSATQGSARPAITNAISHPSSTPPRP